MGQVGCYTLDLYCDNDKSENYGDRIHGYKEFPITFSHEKGSVCRTMARKDGWILGRDGSAICPKCSGQKRRSRQKRKENKPSGSGSQ